MTMERRAVTRREIIRLSSLLTAGFLLGSKVQADANNVGAIDVHGHVWTDDFLDLMAKYGKKDVAIQRGKGAGIGETEIEKRFAMMDSAGIAMQALSICPQGPQFEDKEHAVTAARKANDLYLEVVHKWPKRFVAYAAVPLPHVDESLKELERVLDQRGFVGATIPTSILDKSIADPAFMPFYEELNRRGSVLFVHPGGYGANSPLIQDFHLTWMIGAPVEDTIAVAHLILRGIPQKYPKLKIINTHLGGALPMLMQRLDNLYTWENPSLSELPSITARRMWYDTVGHGYDPALKAGVSSIGADRLVFGTDFPYEPGPLFKRSIDYISEVGLKKDEVEQILRARPMQLLGI
jgi:predicted TIM-barrel fold metal-dependent hydrolase